MKNDVVIFLLCLLFIFPIPSQAQQAQPRTVLLWKDMRLVPVTIIDFDVSTGMLKTQFRDPAMAFSEVSVSRKTIDPPEEYKIIPEDQTAMPKTKIWASKDSGSLKQIDAKKLLSYYKKDTQAVWLVRYSICTGAVVSLEELDKEDALAKLPIHTRKEWAGVRITPLIITRLKDGGFIAQEIDHDGPGDSREYHVVNEDAIIDMVNTRGDYKPLKPREFNNLWDKHRWIATWDSGSSNIIIMRPSRP
jgi:hypothetical protein